VFAVKREILEEMLRDPEWSRRIEEAKSVAEIAEIVAEYCRKKGYRVRRVRL